MASTEVVLRLLLVTLACATPLRAAAVQDPLLDAAIARVAGNALPPDSVVPSSLSANEAQYPASLALSIATELVNAAPSLPKRHTAMLYVSNGYPLDPLDPRLTAFVSAAQRFQIPVFAMNARALPGAPARLLQNDAARLALLNTLRVMAEPTGGIAILNNSDFVDRWSAATGG